MTFYIFIYLNNTWDNYQGNLDLMDIIYVYYKNQEAKEASVQFINDRTEHLYYFFVIVLKVLLTKKPCGRFAIERKEEK